MGTDVLEKKIEWDNMSLKEKDKKRFVMFIDNGFETECIYLGYEKLIIQDRETEVKFTGSASQLLNHLKELFRLKSL